MYIQLLNVMIWDDEWILFEKCVVLNFFEDHGQVNSFHKASKSKVIVDNLY